jgi:hypothetical protein
LAVWKNLHHLTSSPHKRFQFKIKVSENWTLREEKDLEVVKVAGKGKRSAFLSERDSPKRLDRPEI